MGNWDESGLFLLGKRQPRCWNDFKDWANTTWGVKFFTTYKSNWAFLNSLRIAAKKEEIKELGGCRWYIFKLIVYRLYIKNDGFELSKRFEDDGGGEFGWQQKRRESRDHDSCSAFLYFILFFSFSQEQKIK